MTGLRHSLHARMSGARLLRMLRMLGSRGWMLTFFLFALASALVSVQWPEWITPVWTLPLALFAISLMASIATNARLRRDAALLGLHLGLLMFVVLVLLSRLTYLDGAVTLTQGTGFDGRLQVEYRGPLHPDRLARLRFANEGFTEDFEYGARWQATSNRVRWWDAQGISHVTEIGDDHPLMMDGYRVYATRNRGYSPVFRWQPAKGEEEVGTVQLRAGEHDMANDWQLPGGPQVWAMLAPASAAPLQPGQQRPNLGAPRLVHDLVLRVGERREVLRTGESLALPEGRLTYIGLDTWMGYRVVYDVAMYWMAAAAAVVAVCMIAFYARIVWRGNAANTEGEQPCD